jgi:hypothetical protein
MANTYSFVMTVTTQVKVIVESETELTPAEVIEKAKMRECDFDLDELDWEDLKYALVNLSVEDVEIEKDED